MSQSTRAARLTGNRLDDAEETDGPLEVVTDMVGLSDGAKETDGLSDEEMDMDGRLSDGAKEMDGPSDEGKETDEFLDGTKEADAGAEATEAMGGHMGCIEGWLLLSGCGQQNDIFHESKKSH